jgi:esterase/lipase superfamily enzyme/TRAP-type C4-dicarboxylate transport system substrate-binding protein
MRLSRFFPAIALIGSIVAAGIFLTDVSRAQDQQQVIRVLLDPGFDQVARQFVQRIQQLLPPQASKNVRFDLQTIGSPILSRLEAADWEMAIFSSTVITRAQIGSTTAAFELPYVFSNLKSVQDLQRSPQGYAGLGNIGGGMTGFVYLNDGSTLWASKVEPKSPADIKGKKIAISSTSQPQTFQKMGASPVTIGKSEIFDALTRGTVDAAEFRSAKDDNPPLSKGHFLLTDSVQARVAIVATRDGVWDRVPFVYRAMIGDAAIAASRELDRSLVEAEERLLNRARSDGVSLVTFGRESTARATQQWISEQPEAFRSIYFKAYDQLKSTNQPGPAAPTAAGRRGSVGRFYFATTRDDTGDASFSYRFGDTRTDVLKCGQVEYAKDSPTQGEALFVGQIIEDGQKCNAYLDSAIQSSKQVLIFVHGFNNRFSEASERAMALKNAVGNDVEVLLWSWPSKRDGLLGKYDYDKESVTGITLQIFVRLLRSMKSASEATKIDILAHSMGGWHTIGALQQLADDAQRLKLLNVVLAAPDVPTDEFEFSLDNVHRSASRITLYACSWDWALTTSSRLNAHTRAGTGGDQDILVNNKVDSIDVDGRWLSINHSYVFEAGSVLSDLVKLMTTDSDASGRGLLKAPKTPYYYWKLP